MGKVAINENTLMSIADAIREKSGTTQTYRPGEMAGAISSFSIGDGEAKKTYHLVMSAKGNSNLVGNNFSNISGLVKGDLDKIVCMYGAHLIYLRDFAPHNGYNFPAFFLPDNTDGSCYIPDSTSNKISGFSTIDGDYNYSLSNLKNYFLMNGSTKTISAYQNGAAKTFYNLIVIYED